jgi:hypothetical protein
MEETMTTAPAARLELSAEEAQKILSMCLMSPVQMDRTAESAMRKLAAYCSEIDRTPSGPDESKQELSNAG